MRFFGDNRIKLACIIALIAALVGAVADVLLLYNPAGGYETGDYSFLLTISDTRLLAGSFLGVFFIPFEILGLVHIYKAIKPAGKIIYPIIFLGVYAVFPGVAYHGTVGLTATFVKFSEQLPDTYKAFSVERLEYIKSLFEPLGLALFVAFAIVSLLFAYVVVFKKTHYRSWMALFNPLAIYVVFVLLYLVYKPLGAILVPAGFNLAFFFFFLCSILAVKKKETANS